MGTELQKFQKLLSEKLFQDDAASLDFGIYRILNMKRTEIEEFIEKRLPEIVDEAFQTYNDAQASNVDQQLILQCHLMDPS